MDHFNYSHFFSLPTQGNIYTLTNLELANGTSKLLVATLKREIYCFEYIEGPDGQLFPTSKEVSFTYIPTGAEIISIDAFNKSSKSNEFIIGVTIIKNSGNVDTVETYLNIYSGLEASDDFNLENIAQNCQYLELNFTPYRLVHTDIIHWENETISSREKVFLLSGHDHIIHVFGEGPDHTFKEIDSKESFPELVKFPSPVIWMEVKYINGDSVRLLALGCECGYLKLVKVCVKEKKILFSFFARLDNYISQVRLYETENKINMVVVNSSMNPLVFRDVLTYGLSDYESLPMQTINSISSCCLIADVDLDRNLEILVGNSGEEVIMYKCSNEGSWVLADLKEVHSPIMSLAYIDITGDGVKELIVFSMKGVHVFQMDPEFVQKILDERCENLTESQLKVCKDIIFGSDESSGEES